MNTSQAIIVKFGEQHVAYASVGAAGAPASLYASHIRSAGLTPENVTLTKQPNGSYRLYIPGVMDQYSTGYYTRKTFPLIGQNRFYNWQQAVYNSGIINVANNTGPSPRTVTGLSFTSGYSVTAINQQAYPSGYLQIFDYWEVGGVNKGTSITLSPVFVPSPTVTAVFYQAAPVTFTPSGGGQITVDGVTRSIPYTKNCRVAPGSPPQVSATAVTLQDYNLLTQYVFSKWTKSSTGQEYFTAQITFTPSATETWTAAFYPKPLPLNDVAAGGDVGDPVSITWAAHPNAANFANYKIYRRVKHNGVLGPEQLNATISSRTTTQYTDWDYEITAGYTHDLLNYDVRVEFTNSQTSDPSYAAGAFGRLGLAKFNKEGRSTEPGMFPKGYALTAYPNPFNPETRIRIELPEASELRVAIYDLSGREVAILADRSVPPGVYEYPWGGEGAAGKATASGTYLVRVHATPHSGGSTKELMTKLLFVK